MLKSYVLAAVISVVAAGAGEATQPMDALKCDIDRITTAVRTVDSGADGGKETRMETLAIVMEEMFDFPRIAHGMVARHWARFNAGQKAAFTEVVSRLLGRSYVRKIEKFCKGESVVFLEQDFSGEKKVEVKTRLPTKYKDVSVNYRMRFNGERWKIYDIRVGGVSVLRNYGRQFHAYLNRETPGKLIRRLRKKVEGERS